MSMYFRRRKKKSKKCSCCGVGLRVVIRPKRPVPMSLPPKGTGSNLVKTLDGNKLRVCDECLSNIQCGGCKMRLVEIEKGNKFDSFEREKEETRIFLLTSVKKKLEVWERTNSSGLYIEQSFLGGVITKDEKGSVQDLMECEKCKYKSVTKISEDLRKADKVTMFSRPVHVDHICDQCHERDKTERSIVGTRFTCKVCKDYDLCERCHKNDLHDKAHEFHVFEHPEEEYEEDSVFLKLSHDEMGNILSFLEAPSSFGVFFTCRKFANYFYTSHFAFLKHVSFTKNNEYDRLMILSYCPKKQSNFKKDELFRMMIRGISQSPLFKCFSELKSFDFDMVSADSLLLLLELLPNKCKLKQFGCLIGNIELPGYITEKFIEKVDFKSLERCTISPTIFDRIKNSKFLRELVISRENWRESIIELDGKCFPLLQSLRLENMLISPKGTFPYLKKYILRNTNDAMVRDCPPKFGDYFKNLEKITTRDTVTKSDVLFENYEKLCEKLKIIDFNLGYHYREEENFDVFKKITNLQKLTTPQMDISHLFVLSETKVREINVSYQFTITSLEKIYQRIKEGKVCSPHLRKLNLGGGNSILNNKPPERDVLKLFEVLNLMFPKMEEFFLSVGLKMTSNIGKKIVEMKKLRVFRNHILNHDFFLTNYIVELSKHESLERLSLLGGIPEERVSNKIYSKIFKMKNLQELITNFGACNNELVLKYLKGTKISVIKFTEIDESHFGLIEKNCKDVKIIIADVVKGASKTSAIYRKSGKHFVCVRFVE